MRTVVWDVDDVLNDLMYQWFMRAWLPEHPDCRTEYTGLSENPPHAALGVAREEYLASMDAFRKTNAGIHLTPNAEVLEWFAAHGSRFRHIALTARPLETAPEVAAWVMRHFGAWIRCFGVVPTRPGEGIPMYDRGKGDFLRWLGKGDVFVDDTEENLKQAGELGFKTLTWPQPWNSSKQSSARTLAQLSNMAG
jgi:FMN phosphatase YigB (HAD superfamily)